MVSHVVSYELFLYEMLHTVEFDQAFQSDTCRLQQLQCHSADPQHPFNRFMWGMLPLNNLWIPFLLLASYWAIYFMDFSFDGSYTGNRKSLMEPMSKGIDMRAKILNFYTEYYLAGRMKLAVIGGGE